MHDGLTLRQRRVLEALTTKSVRAEKLLRELFGEQVSSLETELIAPPERPAEPLAAYLDLVQMAQPFRMRYPLVESIGNIGNIDGDPPADIAFTQFRLSAFGEAVMRGVAPNLLANGVPGFLPHHLGEVLDAASALIANPDLADDDLLAFINGPDFPTGGVVPSTAEIRRIYETGRGELRVRSRVEMSGPRIVVTEIPYGTSKRDLLEGVSGRPVLADILDESDPSGVRIVVVLRSGVDPQHALEQLPLETTLRVDMQGVTMAALLRTYARNRTASEIEALRNAHADLRRTTIGGCGEIS